MAHPVRFPEAPTTERPSPKPETCSLSAAKGSRPAPSLSSSRPRQLSEGTAASEFFGHRKRAFTGADRTHDGIILTAHRSRPVIFLDDVGECPPNVQAKLLTVLDDGVFRPVGSDQMVSVGLQSERRFQTYASSQPRSLAKLRVDLLERFNTVLVRMPPKEGIVLEILNRTLTKRVRLEDSGAVRPASVARRLATAIPTTIAGFLVVAAVSGASPDPRGYADEGATDSLLSSVGIALDEVLAQRCLVCYPCGKRGHRVEERSPAPGRGGHMAFHFTGNHAWKMSLKSRLLATGAFGWSRGRWTSTKSVCGTGMSSTCCCGAIHHGFRTGPVTLPFPMAPRTNRLQRSTISLRATRSSGFWQRWQTITGRRPQAIGTATDASTKSWKP